MAGKLSISYPGNIKMCRQGVFRRQVVKGCNNSMYVIAIHLGVLS